MAKLTIVIVVSVLLLLLGLLTMNVSRTPGKMSQISRWSPLQPQPAAAELMTEVQELRLRVKALEERLGAKLVSTHPPRVAERREAHAFNPARRPAPAAEDHYEDPFAEPAKTAPATAPAAVAAATKPAAIPVAAVAPATAAAVVAAADAGPSRPTAPAPPGQVPNASWWSPLEVEMGGGLWCRKPPPYAALKPPLVTVEPPTDKPKLTAALAKKHASEDNMLIVTYVNYNRLDFAYTLVKHLLLLGNPHYLVGALDEDALRGLQKNSIPTFFMDSGLTTKDYGWGTYNFRQLGLHKVNLVLDLAKTGVDCLTIDADAFALRDPFPYFRDLAKADVLMSSDHLTATNGYSDYELEGASGFHSAFNIGYIFIRARALEFVQRWRDMCFSRPNDWDQVLFASVLRMGSSGTSAPKRLKAMYKLKNGTHLLAGVLPVSLFASGHTFFVSRMAHLMQQHPYMVHTTFQYGGAQGKRHRLRESMVWEDEPSYYSQPNFLSYDIDLPFRLVYPNGGDSIGPDGTQPLSMHMDVAAHFELVHHQLLQMRNAFALARKLDRILILPRLVCGLDRWWAPHSAIIPGSAARLPLLECPADHVIDLERMGKPEKFLREQGMLCNPRTPNSVREGIRRMGLEQLALPEGNAAEKATKEGAALVERLKSDASKVLHITSALPDYRTILGGSERTSFVNEVRSWGGLWCCRHPPGGRGAGHTWYDFFADVIPHRDRHNRLWDKKWTPLMGP